MGGAGMFAVTAIPSVLFLIASLMVPRAAVGWRPEDARRKLAEILERLGGHDYAERVLRNGWRG